MGRNEKRERLGEWMSERLHVLRLTRAGHSIKVSSDIGSLLIRLTLSSSPPFCLSVQFISD